jgi:hypothetical protein
VCPKLCAINYDASEAIMARLVIFKVINNDVVENLFIRDIKIYKEESNVKKVTMFTTQT